MSWLVITRCVRGRHTGLIISWGRYRRMVSATPRLAPPSLRRLSVSAVEAERIAGLIAALPLREPRA